MAGVIKPSAAALASSMSMTSFSYRNVPNARPSCCNHGGNFILRHPRRQGRVMMMSAQSKVTAAASPAVLKKRMALLGGRSASSDDGGAGTGLLERPTVDPSQFDDSSSQLLEGGDIGRLKDRRGVGSGDSYRVLLLDDIRHSENLVAKVLPQVVPSVTPDGARKLFHESRAIGIAVVIVAVKEHAEFYAQMLVRGGLRSTIEPDSNIA